VLRPAAESDRATLRAFIEHDVAGTPYAAVPRYFLGLAFAGRTRESRAVVAVRDDEPVGFALYGEVAGTVATGRMHFVSVTASARLHAIGSRLCEAAISDMIGRGMNRVVAEVPDDPVLVSGRALLARSGFVEEARVADYYRDGVALLILRLDPARQPG
jgi:ribosomal protein S18 acetylase RimI-like enzyme